MSYVNDVLVGIEFYQNNKDNSDYKFIEVDSINGLYQKGHPLSALYLDWETQLNDSVKRTIVSREALMKQLGKLGVAGDHTIVLFGDQGNWFAAFGYWILKMYGHEKVKLLNGGRQILEKNVQFTTDVPEITETEYSFLNAERSELRAKRDDVLNSFGKSQFVDVRSPAEYSGEVIAPEGMTETAQRGGHIPTAINQPWSDLVKEDGTFLSYGDAKQVYTDKGITDKEEIIAYCRIGERSSHSWFVLHELLGYEKVKNYDGSWTEYGNLVDVPITKGDQPGSVW